MLKYVRIYYEDAYINHSLLNKIKKEVSDSGNATSFIAGAGPAGVSAALYAVRMGFPPLVIHNGYGALERAKKIENYYGLPAPIPGKGSTKMDFLNYKL